MIAFSCSCGQKFKIKPEFAGRKTSCPTCKQSLVVPSFDHTQAYIPNGQIDGTPSSIAQLGMEGGVTLESPSGGKTGQKSVKELLGSKAKKGERYVIEGEIARGGMGAVLRAVDCDIRREVAVKYMLDQADAKKQLRFIEEAQITGQLEHPNIPPVHELGVDKEQRLFFSMKMVKGRSLAQILDELRTNPKMAEKEYPLGRLLNIFVNVCHGLAYAHSRNVVHRDLKPANIMVGDFGETYVMDWGLAKVLNHDGQAVPMASVIDAPVASVPTAASVSASQSVSSKRSSKVATSREGDADLTQDGAILGTPVYMPPEQAAGRIQAIDQRSDIYSLGAILYELLTLQPPIEKEGGYLAVLMRVASGEIVPPEQRDPKRTRTGKIPRELAAVAMKAMAKEPRDRYQRVEDLRKDIELFQEGRSVSAKQDTKREMLLKFVKRNKGFSAATGVGLLLLLGSLVVIFQAWLATERAYADYKKEHDEKEKQTRDAVPALVKAARLGVVQRDYPNALDQVNLALRYAPEDADALLLKGQLLIVHQDFAGARVELEKYLRLQRGDAAAKSLVELCQKPHSEDESTSLGFARVFNQQEAYGLVDGVLARYGKTSVEAQKFLLQKYRNQLEVSWPGEGKRLEITTAGLRLNLSHSDWLRDLSPLKGMPLTSLDIGYCREVRDLSPLKGMPLTSLDLTNGQVQDLTPLKGMPLTTLSLWGCVQVRDLTPLKGMPLTSLNLNGCEMQDLTPLKGMPLTSLSFWKCNQLRDLTPLKGMPLTSLNLTECFQLRDLTGLQGLKLTHLTLWSCFQVQDLTPLKDMPLNTLNLGNCPVRDLTPLKDMPLTYLNLVGCRQVSNLTPLDGMRLQELFLPEPLGPVKGLEVLRRMKTLKTIGFFDANKQFPATEFWKRFDAGEFK